MAPAKFSKPRTISEAQGRVELNLHYYLTNYLIICLVFFTVAILSSPLLVFILALLGFMWHSAMKTSEIKITPNIILKGREKLAVCSIVSALTILIVGGAKLFATLGLCFTVVLLHSAFHVAPSTTEEQALDNESAA